MVVEVPQDRLASRRRRGRDGARTARRGRSATASRWPPPRRRRSTARRRGDGAATLLARSRRSIDVAHPGRRSRRRPGASTACRGRGPPPAARSASPTGTAGTRSSARADAVPQLAIGQARADLELDAGLARAGALRAAGADGVGERHAHVHAERRRRLGRPGGRDEQLDVEVRSARRGVHVDAAPRRRGAAGARDRRERHDVRVGDDDGGRPCARSMTRGRAVASASITASAPPTSEPTAAVEPALVDEVRVVEVVDGVHQGDAGRARARATHVAEVVGGRGARSRSGGARRRHRPRGERVDVPDRRRRPPRDGPARSRRTGGRPGGGRRRHRVGAARRRAGLEPRLVGVDHRGRTRSEPRRVPRHATRSSVAASEHRRRQARRRRRRRRARPVASSTSSASAPRANAGDRACRTPAPRRRRGRTARPTPGVTTATRDCADDVGHLGGGQCPRYSTSPPRRGAISSVEVRGRRGPDPSAAAAARPGGRRRWRGGAPSPGPAGPSTRRPGPPGPCRQRCEVDAVADDVVDRRRRATPRRWRARPTTSAGGLPRRWRAASADSSHGVGGRVQRRR